MLKYIFILLNVAFLAGFRAISDKGDKTTITQSIPLTALTGTEFEEDIVINKPTSVNSFAKFEQQLPKGMVAVGLDLKGGVLSQDENNVVKIIWYKISDLDQFTIKLRILVDHETSLNEYALNSRFAYLENNKRYSIASETSKITIEKGAPKALDENEKELVQVSDTTFHRALTENIDKMLREAGVACTQVSEMMNKTETKINIRIIKGNITGFGKIEIPICEGTTAVNLENNGGVFSIVDGKIKYVWTELPTQENINVTYKLIRDKAAGWLTRCTVGGDFSYLKGEKSMKCDFNTITVDYEKGITVANVPLPPNAGIETAKQENKPVAPDTAVNKTAVNTEVAKVSQPEQVLQKEVKPIEELSMVPEPVNNQITELAETSQKSKEAPTIQPANSNPTAGALTFRVQICATHQQVNAGFVKSTYKLVDEVMQEMHEGWLKFTVGGYSQYADARNKREDLAPYNLPGPFVTAYNNSNRITVQEALMISKQQWVK